MFVWLSRMNDCVGINGLIRDSVDGGGAQAVPVGITERWERRLERNF